MIPDTASQFNWFVRYTTKDGRESGSDGGPYSTRTLAEEPMKRAIIYIEECGHTVTQYGTKGVKAPKEQKVIR